MSVNSFFSIQTATRNIQLITNNSTNPSTHLRIVTTPSPNGEPPQQSIKINGIFRRIIYSLFKQHTKPTELKKLLTKNILLLSKIHRHNFINYKTGEVKELFIAAQRYNQTLTNKHLRLFNDLHLKTPRHLILNSRVPEIKPLTLSQVTNARLECKGHDDTPYMTRNGILRYHKDVAHINHTAESIRIFINTQKERLLSIIGKGIEAVFRKNIKSLQTHHYFRNNEHLKPNTIYSKDAPFSDRMTPSSYWLGHASCLLKIPLTAKDSSQKTAVYMITDPVEGDLNTILYPRQTKVARKMKDCPAPHIYLLSHNHLDHYSKPTIQKLLDQQPLMIVPLGDGERFIKMGFKHVIEQNWWNKATITLKQDNSQFEMSITAVPAHHWAGQGPCNGGHKSTFQGYVIQGAEKGDIYFAGDTARLHENHVSDLKDMFNIRWMFQPGGPDEVRADMESSHQASVDGLWMHFSVIVMKLYDQYKSRTWNEFLQACRETKTIYMHTKTFKLGNLHFDDTESSIETVKKMLRATTAPAISQKTHLQRLQYIRMQPYEKQVYHELLAFGKKLIFNGRSLTPQQIADLLDASVIVPKIGSRTEFHQ